MMLKTALKDNKGSAQNWIMAIAFLLIVGTGVYVLVFKNFKPKLPGVSKSNETTSSAKAEDPSLHQALTVGDVVKRPNVYENKKVLLLRVLSSSWVTDKAFVVSDMPVKTKNGTKTPPERLLILRKEPFSLPEHAPDGMIALGEDKKQLEISGTVMYFDSVKIANDWGIYFTEADLKVLKKYEKKPVLIVESIKPYKAK